MMFLPVAVAGAVAFLLYKNHQDNQESIKAASDLQRALERDKAAQKANLTVGGCAPFDPSPLRYTNRYGNRSSCAWDPSPLPPSLTRPQSCLRDVLPPPIQDRSGLRGTVILARQDDPQQMTAITERRAYYAPPPLDLTPVTMQSASYVPTSPSQSLNGQFSSEYNLRQG